MKALFTFAGLFIAVAAFGQQSPQYTQYIFNGLAINPAYAGSQSSMQITASHRSQWTGLDGAPTTQTLSADGAVLESKIGLGLTLVNDKIGAQSNTSVSLSAAVKKELGPKLNVSLGLALGAAQFTLDGTKLQAGSKTPDQAIPPNRESTVLPDLRVGMFLNTERFYTGFSVANMVSFRENQLLVPTPARHFYLTSGYVFDMGPSVKIKPSFLIKEDLKSPTNIDLNTFVLLHERLWLGGSYRMSLPKLRPTESELELTGSNAFAVITQVYATPSLRIGYSYDVSLSQLKNYGSHEVTLGYSFLRKLDGRMLTPRYF